MIYITKRLNKTQNNIITFKNNNIVLLNIKQNYYTQTQQYDKIRHKFFNINNNIAAL